MKTKILDMLVKLDTIEAVSSALNVPMPEVREALLEVARSIDSSKEDFERYEHISVTPRRLGGRPCLAGHCISVAQCIAEIEADADPQWQVHGITGKGSVAAFVKDFDLELDEVHGMLRDVSDYIGRL